MSSWSQRRKSVYALVAVIVVIGAIGVPGFLVLYHPPTCTDGVMNGNEQGVDCGGSCERLCQSSFLAPSLAWTRFEQVAPGRYNLAAYIINPNIAGGASAVPYHMLAFDKEGRLITEVTGAVTLPPHRNTIAFQGAIDMGKRIPAKILFEFTAPPEWRAQKDGLSALAIGDKKYIEDELGSSLTVTLKNTSVYRLVNVGIYTVLYDKDGNALGFSKTVVDEIPAQGATLAPFTWPIDRAGKVISIEVLPVQE